MCRICPLGNYNFLKGFRSLRRDRYLGLYNQVKCAHIQASINTFIKYYFFINSLGLTWAWHSTISQWWLRQDLKAATLKGSNITKEYFTNEHEFYRTNSSHDRSKWYPSSVQKDSPGEPWVSANDRDPVSSITKIFLAGYMWRYLKTIGGASSLSTWWWECWTIHQFQFTWVILP